MNQLSGYVYLHKPVPMHHRSATADLGLALKAPATSGLKIPANQAGHSVSSVSSNSHSQRPTVPPPQEIAPTDPPEAAAPRATVGRLLIFWLETLSGRRAIKTLQRAPFTPAALAELERTIKREQGNLPASKIQSLHIQPSAGHRTRFCASVAFGARVRAVVGTLSWRRLNARMRKPQRTHAWHVEVIQMI